MALEPVVTVGPLLFHWPAERRRDFYFRMADEAPVSTVYLGEVICSKRAPFFEADLPVVIERLRRAGKTVVLSTLAEVTVPLDRRIVREAAGREDVEIEVNDASALFWRNGEGFRVGQFFNCYNAVTLDVLARQGATHVCLPPELPAASVAGIAAAAARHDVGVEVQVLGRMPLALSARCYHARAHGRTKDNCLFVCERDPDGLELETVGERQAFLAINGIQTLSDTCLNLSREVPRLLEYGVTHFRISPHSGDMVAAATTLASLLRAEIGADEADRALSAALGFEARFANGFFHGRPGYLRA